MSALLSLRTIYTIILIEGFVTISLEILAIRQLIPFIGNSVVTTSLIIGIFLLFLALGYQKGGKVIGDYASKLIQNFLIAGILIGIGLSFPFLEIYFGLMNRVASDYLLSTLTLYLLAILAPSIYFLGQTVPIVMHLRDQEGTAGRVGGKVLFLSTIGSFLGAVLTSLICMRFLGVAQTVMLNYLCLVGLVGLIVFYIKEQHLSLVIGLLAAVPVFVMNVYFEQIHFLKTTNFANYFITDTHQFYNTKGQVLVINSSYSSYINDQGQGFEYIEKIRSIFHDLNYEGKHILVLGAGGFVLGQNDKKNRYTYIDIDKGLVDLVKDHQFVDEINGEVVIKDARQYLLATNQKYDAIVLDAYSHKHAIPTHLTTQAFFELARDHLNPDGIFISNVIVDPWLESDFAQNIDNTLRAVFEYCSQNPLHFKKKSTNNIYVCKPAPDKSQLVYQDNSNQNEFDVFYQDRY